MSVTGAIARLLDALLEAADDLLEALGIPTGEVTPMDESPRQEYDPLELADCARAKVQARDEGDFCAFGRKMADKLLVQFIRAQRKGEVKWKDGTGCFKARFEICVTEEEPDARCSGGLTTYSLATKCIKICIDGDCVKIC